MCTSCGKSARVTSSHPSTSTTKSQSQRGVVASSNMYGRPKVKISFGSKNRNR